GVLQLLEKIQKIYQNTIVIVTHDMAVHANIAHRIAIMYAGKIVEVGKTKDIFKNPKHPYTRYLINSLPKIGDKSVRESAPGSPPSLLNPPLGCRFHPRCPYVMEKCNQEVPRLVEIDSGHSVACFLFTGEVE
ncbi:MAG: oligopeptide/dipeptide ABC transporter ATP-binding protein, partial [Dictyoglomus sp.]